MNISPKITNNKRIFIKEMRYYENIRADKLFTAQNKGESAADSADLPASARRGTFLPHG